MKRTYILSAVVVAVLTACGGGGSSSPNTTPVVVPPTCNAPQILVNGSCTTPATPTVASLTMSCATTQQTVSNALDTQINADWDHSPNNGWGLTGLTGFQFCTGAAAISPTQAIGRWTWDLGANTAPQGSWVKGYTYIGQGVNVGFPDHSPTFPKLVSSVNSLQATWDADITHAKSPTSAPTTTVGDGGNLLLEMYISSSDKPVGADASIRSFKYEVSFNVVRWGSMEFETAGSQIVVIDGNTYKFFVRQQPPTGPQLNFVVADGYKPKGTLNLKKVLDWLKAQNYVLDTDWVLNVQLGTEYSEGVGEAKLNLLDIKVN